MSKVHPAFEKANDQHRWSGSLADLWPVLRKRAYDLNAAVGKGEAVWAWVILPHGALVALRIRPDDFRKELRIARSEPVETEEQRRKWEIEVGTFLKHFGCERWQRIDEQASRGVAVRFVELYSNEHAVNRARCTACGQETKSTPILSPMLCPDCARARRGGSPQRHLELVR